MEQLRQTAALSESFEVIFEETVHVTMSQEKFLANRSNKIRLISMLMQKLQSVNIVTKQARDDADVLVIKPALENSHLNTTAVVVNKFSLLIWAKEKLRHRYILLIVLAIILIVKSIFYFYMLSLDVIRHLHSSIKEK